MILEQITKHVYVFTTDSERDRPNLGYINGRDFSVIIDSGNSRDHLNAFLRAIKEKGLKSPSICILTHWHWDHTYGLHAFNGMSIASKDTNDKLLEMSKWKWDKDSMNARLSTGLECQFCHDYIQVEYDNPLDIKVVPATLSYKDEMSLNLGNLEIDITRVDSPHTNDGSLVFINKDNVLFAGDNDSGDFYALQGGYVKQKFYDYVDRVKDLPFEYYVHGHVPVMTKEQTKEFWKTIEAEEL